MMSVYGKRCLKPGCTGRVTFEVGLVGADCRVVCSDDQFSTRIHSCTISSGTTLIFSMGKLR
jgi:hypothetical protein